MRRFEFMSKPLLTLIAIIWASVAFGQLKYIAPNLEKFDQRRYHFGFIAGVNSSNLKIDLASLETRKSHGFVRVDNQSLPGIDLFIVTSLTIHKNLRLRSTPGISFQDRKLVYYFETEDGIEEIIKNTESTNIEIPLYLKFRTNRYGNFAAYIHGGGKYIVDMASKKKDESAFESDQKLGLDRKSFSVMYGVGFDFYLPYFKFGIELRQSRGLNSILRQNNDRFSGPFESIFGEVFQFCLTFEG